MAGQLERSGSAAIMIKDLDIAASMASAVAHPLPVGSLVSSALSAAGDSGLRCLWHDRPDAAVPWRTGRLTVFPTLVACGAVFMAAK